MTFFILSAALLIVLYTAHELRHAPSADDAGQATVPGRWLEL